MIHLDRRVPRLSTASRGPGRDGRRESARLVQISGLRAFIGDTLILHDVNLSLDEGEIYGLIGPNGAGKSTTIAVALGLLPPDAGEVLVFGENARSAAPGIYARLGVLPEQNGFYDWMSAEAYLTFFAGLHARETGPDDVRKSLSTVGLEPRPHQRISTYSRGMRQRLGLARALLAEPELLILDEPTNGLDPRGRREVHDILLELAKRGVGVLLCTHLLDDVDRLCQRIGIIVEGRTVAEGPVSDLVRNEAGSRRFRLRLAGAPPEGPDPQAALSIIARDDPWVTVALRPGVAPAAAWHELVDRGWPIDEIHRAAGGLENLYLDLTRESAS